MLLNGRIVLGAFAAVFLVAEPSYSQQRTPVASITEATWPQYQSEYFASPLCTEDEITLWRCDAEEQAHALCSSQVVTRTSGYMQYRVLGAESAVQVYPEQLRPPLGVFEYTAYGNGNASVDFTYQGAEYRLFDPLRDVSAIYISAPASPDELTTIECGANQTLQLNYSMRLMYDAGIWLRP